MSDAEQIFRGALATQPVALSAAGHARRAALRGLLQDAVVRRRQRRQGVRAVAGLLLLAVACVALWPAHGASAGLSVEQIHDQPGIVAELTVRGLDALRIDPVGDDDSLRQLLEAAQGPAGLIRVPGRLLLETRSDVTE